MEKSLAEIPTSQEVQINEQQTWHNGSVSPANTKFGENPPNNWYDRSHTSVCRDFNRGNCSRGRICKYRHCLLGEQERSSQICRDFLRGNCTYGVSCKFRHPDKHDTNLGNLVNLGIPREIRSTAPCWSFMRGMCLRGEDCVYSHSENPSYVRPMNGNLQQGDGKIEGNENGPDRRPRSPCRKFLRGSCLRGSSCPYMHDKGLTDAKGALHAEDTDLDSRNQSCDGGPRIRPHGEFGNDKQIKEFCLKFSKGRCDRGDSCRYLHSFHNYAKSNPVVADKEHLSEKDGAHYHVDNGSESQNIDQKGEVDDGDVSLWSQPFKRRKSWSESPFIHRDDVRHGRENTDEFRNSFKRDFRYDLVPFRYRPHSKVRTTSTDSPRRINEDSDIEIRDRNRECEVEKGDLCCDSQLAKAEVMCNGMRVGGVDSNNPILHREVDISKGRIGPIEVELESTNPECDNSLRSNNGELSSYSYSERDSLRCENGSNLDFKGKLLILDVNGILADIVADYPESFQPDTVVSLKGVFKRPFCDDFLDFCFERFDVGVWSSRNKKNVDKVIDFLMGDSKEKLLFCWDQSYCTDTGYKTVENRDKPLVLKELRRLWEKQVDDLPWEEGYYNETNTILLDDSPYKALRNPPYTAVFPFPYTFKDSKDTDLGPNGKLRLYLESLSKSDNVQKFVQENPFGQRPITKSNLSWRFYSNIVDDY